MLLAPRAPWLMSGAGARRRIVRRNDVAAAVEDLRKIGELGGDARDRRTVADLLPPEVGRVFPVGRLDSQQFAKTFLRDL